MDIDFPLKPSWSFAYMSTETQKQTTEHFGTEEVSEITGISSYTIRYYDNCGFFPSLKRGTRRVRFFTQKDIDQLKLVDALRKSGLSIEGIQYYVRLEGKSSTIEERATILQSQKNMLEMQREELAASIEVLQDSIDRLQNE